MVVVIDKKMKEGLLCLNGKIEKHNIKYTTEI